MDPCQPPDPAARTLSHNILQSLISWRRDWHLWFGVCLWHLTRTYPPPLTLLSPHLRSNGRCEKTDQRPRLEPGFRARYMTRIVDQSEIKVRAQSVTRIQAHSGCRNKAQGAECDQVRVQAGARVTAQSMTKIRAQPAAKKREAKPCFGFTTGACGGASSPEWGTEPPLTFGWASQQPSSCPSSGSSLRFAVLWKFI